MIAKIIAAKKSEEALMVQKFITGAVILAIAACDAASDKRISSDAEKQKSAFVESQILAGCVSAREPVELCTCLSNSIVTDIDMDVLELFHGIITADGVEELNHGDWQDDLAEPLLSKVEAHMKSVRASCAPE